MKKYFIVLICILCLQGLGTDGYPQLVFYSLEDALDYGEVNQTDFLIRQMESKAADYSENISKSHLYPTLKTVNTFDNYLQLPVQLIPAEIFGGEPGTFREVQFGTQYQINLGLELSLPLINTDAWNAAKLAKLNREMLNQNHGMETFQWKEQVARNYYLTLLNLEASRLAHADWMASDSIFRFADIQYQKGMMEPLPYQRLKASAQKAKAQFVQQEKTVVQSQNQLKLLLGIGADMTITLEETLEVREEKAFDLDYAVRALPELLVLNTELSRSEREFKSARQQALPNLSAVARYSQQAWSDDLRLGSANWFEVGLVGLRMDWTIFGAGRLRQQAKLERTNWEIAQERVKQREVTLEIEKANLLEDFQSSKVAFQLFADALENYSDNFRIAQLHYKEGLITVDELLNVQQELWQNERQYLGSLADYYISKALLTLRSNY